MLHNPFSALLIDVAEEGVVGREHFGQQHQLLDRSRVSCKQLHFDAGKCTIRNLGASTDLLIVRSHHQQDTTATTMPNWRKLTVDKSAFWYCILTSDNSAAPAQLACGDVLLLVPALLLRHLLTNDGKKLSAVIAPLIQQVFFATSSQPLRSGALVFLPAAASVPPASSKVPLHRYVGMLHELQLHRPENEEEESASRRRRRSSSPTTTTTGAAAPPPPPPPAAPTTMNRQTSGDSSNSKSKLLPSKHLKSKSKSSLFKLSGGGGGQNKQQQQQNVDTELSTPESLSQHEEAALFRSPKKTIRNSQLSDGSTGGRSAGGGGAGLGTLVGDGELATCNFPSFTLHGMDDQFLNDVDANLEASLVRAAQQQQQNQQQQQQQQQHQQGTSPEEGEGGRASSGRGRQKSKSVGRKSQGAMSASALSLGGRSAASAALALAGGASEFYDDTTASVPMQQQSSQQVYFNHGNLE